MTHNDDEGSRVEDTQYAAPSATAPTDKLIQPLPWTTERRSGDLSTIRDVNGFALMEFTHDEAEFITRACNAHDGLLAALRVCRAVIGSGSRGARIRIEPEAIAQADAAIAKAEAGR